ncbi:hypothetical protein COLO4_29177 [Corchorus olitorius]|uniref:Aminotransferase-like plant mobile domain-containing protein n=1 Tax=Corchorus olitorius TaxID=93759 RepID=A0A1R3HG16_9ROSI|nr:hypothetical protein COLO4_29177 [Corchorus olitorius]
MNRKARPDIEVTYRFVEPAENIKTWGNIEPAAKQKLEGTGFDNLLKLTSPAKRRLNLLTALVDTYDYERRCLRFGGDINLFFGLGDVLRITGLPIDGKPVIVKDVDARYLCQKYLGKTELFKEHLAGIPFAKLREFGTSFEGRNNLEGQELEFYVRALCLYLIGSVVISQLNHVVPPVYLLFLKDIDDIENYAWGAALLSNLHRSLENHIKYGTDISASVNFLTVFVLESVPRVAFHVLHPRATLNDALLLEDRNDRPMQLPLMVGWHKRMKEQVLIKGSGRLSVAFFRTLFDDLQQNDISYPGDMLNKFKWNLLSLLSYAWRFKVILHDPGVPTGRQLSLSNSKKRKLQLAHAKHDAKNKNKYRGGRKDWPKVHATFVKAWENRLQNLYIDMNDIGEESTSSADRHDEGIPTGTASQGTSLFQDNVEGRSEHSPLNSCSSSSQGIRTEQSHFESTLSPSVQGDSNMLDIRTEIMDEEVTPQVTAQETPIQEQEESMEQQPTYEEVTAHGMIRERAEQNGKKT